MTSQMLAFHIRAGNNLEGTFPHEAEAHHVTKISEVDEIQH